MTGFVCRSAFETGPKPKLFHFMPRLRFFRNINKYSYCQKHIIFVKYNISSCQSNLTLTTTAPRKSHPTKPKPAEHSVNPGWSQKAVRQSPSAHVGSSQNASLPCTLVFHLFLDPWNRVEVPNCMVHSHLTHRPIILNLNIGYWEIGMLE